jgi:hypothetical protein
MASVIMTPVLHDQDTCDRCGARAYLKATLSHGVLYFCARHGARHLPRLSRVALMLQDSTDTAAA